MARPANLSGTLWPIHLKPLEDEVLSSWMVRLARAYDVKPVWFWRLIWPVDFRYVDRKAAGGLLNLLATKTATPFERAVQTTLTAIAENHAVSTAVRYCPACLGEDAEPYFRRRWQVLFLLLCERHSVRLLDHCPHCRRPLKPEFVSVERDSMAWCSRCARDVRGKRDAVPASHACEQVLDWQVRLWNILRQSEANGSGTYRPIPPAAFSRKRFPSRM